MRGPINRRRSFATGLSLTAKVMLMLGAAWAAATVVVLVVQITVVFPSFVALEEREGRKDAARVSESFAGEAAALAKTTRDWAAWEETWKFVQDVNRAYARENLTDDAFKTLDIDAMIFLDTEGRIVWSRILDSKTGATLDLSEFAPGAITRRHSFLWPADTKGPYANAIRKGILRTDAGLMMVVSAPVLRNYEEGPVRGTLVEGKLLTDSFFDKVRTQTHAAFRVETVSAGAQALAGDALEISRAGGILRASFFLRDELSAPLARITIERPAEIISRGRTTFSLSLGLVFVTLAGVIAALLLLMRRTVLDPIERLTHMIVSIRTTGTFVARLGLRRADEIGTLASNFDAMLDQLSEKTRALTELATTDALTGIPNRRSVMDDLEREVARAGRYGEPLAVLMLDIDHFKDVNDSHGHGVGDEVLKSVAGALRSTIREADFVGRFGGEEFLVILSHQDEHGAGLAAERLRREIAETEVGGGRLKVTVSIGVASLTTAGIQDMLLRADRALYAAKGAGRNQVATDPP